MGQYGSVWVSASEKTGLVNNSLMFPLNDLLVRPFSFLIFDIQFYFSIIQVDSVFSTFRFCCLKNNNGVLSTSSSDMYYGTLPCIQVGPMLYRSWVNSEGQYKWVRSHTWSIVNCAIVLLRIRYRVAQKAMPLFDCLYVTSLYHSNLSAWFLLLKISKTDLLFCLFIYFSVSFCFSDVIVTRWFLLHCKWWCVWVVIIRYVAPLYVT